jgi:thioredoxin 1
MAGMTQRLNLGCGTLPRMSDNLTETDVLHVVCLCADWCHNCRAYQPLFDSLQSQFAGTARFAWVDIEDESEVVGEVEVENFPTLLLLRGKTPLFLGPLTPQAGVLTQLVQTGLDGRLQALGGAAECALAARMQAHLATLQT